MKITILKKRIKHNGNEYFKDTVYNLPDAIAEGWIRAGYATEYTEQVPPIVAKPKAKAVAK
jgi:hypothetical protein